MASEDIPQGHKACSKCKEVKLAATSFWKDPTKKNGYTSWCKVCFNKSADKRRAEGPVFVLERDCSICKQRKPADAFMKDSRRVTGLDARCRECRRAQHQARKQRNIDAGAPRWEQKECKRCHEVKPAAMFKKHAYTASGLDSWCKACCSERRKELLAQKALEHVGDPSAKNNKECVQCSRIKPAAEFGKDSQQPTGLARRCKACERGTRAAKQSKRQVAEEYDEEEDTDSADEAWDPSPRGTTSTPPLPKIGSRGRSKTTMAPHEDALAAAAAAAAQLLSSCLPAGAAAVAAATAAAAAAQQHQQHQPVQLLPLRAATRTRLSPPSPVAGGSNVGLNGGATLDPLGVAFGGTGSAHDLAATTALAGSGRFGWGVVSTEGACLTTSSSHPTSGQLFPDGPPSGPLSARTATPPLTHQDLWGNGRGTSAGGAAPMPPPVSLPVPAVAPAAAAAAAAAPPAGRRKPSAFLTGVQPGLVDFERQESVLFPHGMAAQLATDVARGEPWVPGLPRGRAALDAVVGYAAAGRARTESMGVLGAAARNESLRDVTDATRVESLFGLGATTQQRVESLLGTAMRVDSPYLGLFGSTAMAGSVDQAAAMRDLGLSLGMAGGPDVARIDSLFMGLQELMYPSSGVGGLHDTLGSAGASGAAGGGTHGNNTNGMSNGVQGAGQAMRCDSGVRADSLFPGIDLEAAMELGQKEMDAVGMGLAGDQQGSDGGLGDMAMWLGMGPPQQQADGAGQAGAAQAAQGPVHTGPGPGNTDTSRYLK